METLFFFFGSLVGAAVAVFFYKHRKLHEELRRRLHDAGVLTQRVLTLEALLKDAEAAKWNTNSKGD